MNDLNRLLHNTIELSGFEAWHEGRYRYENPHPKYSIEHKLWNEGWDEASGEAVVELSNHQGLTSEDIF